MFFLKNLFTFSQNSQKEKRIKKEKLRLRRILSSYFKKKKEDISGAKLLKLFNLLNKKLKNEGYKAKSQWDFSKKQARMWFSIEKPGKMTKAGPFIDMEKHVSRFKKKYKKWFVKNKRIYAFVIPKPLEKIFFLDKKQLSDMGVNKYSFKKSQ